ncbi:MAG: NUDIX domain-containing protein [Planctomycetota bacterium]
MDRHAQAGDELRHAARVLLLDARGRILLFRFVDPVTAAPFWITPGGGLDPGETHREAAQRELKEETGISLIPSATERTNRDTAGAAGEIDHERIPGQPIVPGTLGPAIWERTVDIRYGNRRFRQREVYFPVRLASHEPEIETSGMLDYEATDLVEYRWWGVSEICASTERFAPSRLATLLNELLDQNVWPTSVVDVGR